jgi:hypothetical protein
MCVAPVDMTHTIVYDEDGKDTGEREWVVGVGARAFNPGDAIPKSTVEKLHLDILGYAEPIPADASVEWPGDDEPGPNPTVPAKATTAKAKSTADEATTDTTGGGK